jgi:hypothetical protein
MNEVRYGHYYIGRESRILYLAIRVDNTAGIGVTLYRQVGQERIQAMSEETFLKTFRYYNP